MGSSSSQAQDSQIGACEPTMTREEFFKAVISRAKMAGVLLVVPAIAETFLVPAAFAAGPSTCNVASTGGAPGDTSTGFDFKNTGPSTDVGQATGSGHVDASCTTLSADTFSASDGAFPGAYLCKQISVC